MATVYSLICWGGKDGHSVTGNSGTNYITLSNHGIRSGVALPVAFKSGTLPTVASGAALAADTTYYAKYISTTTFELYREVGLSTLIDFTSNGTSLVMYSAYWATLSAGDRLRYGSVGSERCYKSMATFIAGRANCSSLDTEVCEIYDEFTDVAPGISTIALPCASGLITTMVNGARSPAWHRGVFPGTTYNGYCLFGGGGGGGITLNNENFGVNGWIVDNTNASGSYGVRLVGYNNYAHSMIVVGPATPAGQGIIYSAPGVAAINCMARRFTSGFFFNGYSAAYFCANNLATGCTTGFNNDAGAMNGKWFNNISIGNTTNWFASFTGTNTASNNAGLSGEAWRSNGGSRITIATTDFTDYSNGVFTPAAATSPQVETGAEHFGVTVIDEADDVRPSYTGSTYGTDVAATALTEGMAYTVKTVGTTDFTLIGAVNNAVTFTDSGDTVGWTAHTVLAGSPVYFSVVTTTTGITANTIYYVINIAANTFQVAASPGGTALPLTTNGSGTVVIATFKKNSTAGLGTGTATALAKTDVGPYEYDWNQGAWPLTRNLDFSGLVSGSQVVVYTTNTATELDRDDNTGTTYQFLAGTSGVTVDYTILKTGYAPIRVTGVALTAESTPVTVQQDLDRAYVTPSGLTFGTNAIVNVTARVVTSLQVTASTTVQNWYSTLMDAWIASSTNTTLKNVAFPVIPFGEASFTVINGIQFSDGATSIAFFKRDGLRYSSNAGTTITAIWAAILTLNTPAGQQVKYRQSPAGAIANAANTGPMDQLVQIYGDVDHGDFDYRDHMVLRAPKPGWSQPQPDLVATYGNLVDGLFVTGLEPVLQYATTDADIDAANLVLDNTAKTFTITAAHTMLELYQRAQWWANQDAQWDADVPLTTTNGGTFTQPSNWSMTGVANLTDGTLAGGSATLAAGTQGIAYNGVTLNLGEEGTYTATITSSIINFSPTANAVTYGMGLGSFSGTIDLRNTHATRAITVEVPAGAMVITTNNTGAAITVSAPALARGITFTGLVAGSTVKVYETTTTTELFSDTNSATSETWSEATAGSRTVDYTIQKAGFLPVRVTGVTVTAAVTGGVITVQIAQIQSRAYQFV